MSGPYFAIQQSLLKYTNDFIERYDLRDFEVFDFDSHSTLEEMPEKHVIGVGEYSITNITEMYEVECFIGVSTMANDANLTILRPVIDKLFSELVPGAREVKIVDPKTGVQIGNLTVRGDVKVLPLAKTQTRPLQLIAVQFGAAFLEPPR